MPKLIDDDVYELVVKALKTAKAYKLPNAQAAYEALTGRVQSTASDTPPEPVKINTPSIKGSDEEME